MQSSRSRRHTGAAAPLQLGLLGPLLYSHATRLDELRRTVLALRIEANLRLDRHQEIIGELTGLVGAEPTREDLSAKLMIAL